MISRSPNVLFCRNIVQKKDDDKEIRGCIHFSEGIGRLILIPIYASCQDLTVVT